MVVAAQDLFGLREKLETARRDFEAGRIGEAAKAYREILDVVPDQPDALHMLGAIAYRMGRTELALELYEETIKSVPNFALAWSNRALLLRVLGRSEEALQSGREAIKLDPNLADGWDIVGLLLRERRQYEAAYEHHARAQALNPHNHHMLNNYAVALAALGRLEEAFQAAQKAAEIDPSFAIAQLTIANIYGAAGWPERAVEHYRKTQILDPSLQEAVASEGRSLMQMGDFENGWAKMEMRGYNQKRFANLPLWQGDKIKHLVLYAEQGVGDIIQFMRYIPFIRDRVEALTLEVPVSLRRLMTAQMPDVNIITPDDPLPAADAHGLLMSLPLLMGTRLDTIPAPIPYIKASETMRAEWRERLSSLPKPHIGVVWMGNPVYGNDHNRSLVLDEIKPLIQAAGPHLVSMQKGSTTATASHLSIYDADAALVDFAATAALIAELDLVITVDTGVAHLAGALGKPVWIMLPFAPDWRWMLGREDSPWYPTARLFRQQTPKDWMSVVARVAAEAKKFIAGDRAVLLPAKWDGKILRQNPAALRLSPGGV